MGVIVSFQNLFEHLDLATYHSLHTKGQHHRQEHQSYLAVFIQNDIFNIVDLYHLQLNNVKNILLASFLRIKIWLRHNNALSLHPEFDKIDNHVYL